MKRAFFSVGLLLVILVGAWLALPRASAPGEPTRASAGVSSSQVSAAITSPPIAAPTSAVVAEAVAEIGNNFPASELVARSSNQGPDGEEHVTILRTTFKYPLIRIVAKHHAAKSAAPLTGVMVADHVIVRPVEAIAPAAFVARIQALGFSVRRHNPRAGTYLVGFPLQADRTDGLDLALARLVEAEDVVAFAEPDHIVSVGSLPVGESAVADGQLWGLNNTGRSGGVPGADIDATAAWAVANDASDAIVAVIDSGLNLAHADLVASLWTNPGEIPGNGIDDDNNGVTDDVHGFNAYAADGDPSDDNGHGTHCAGTIAADGHNASGVVGVAWRGRLMAIKFLSADGVGVTSDAIESIDYAVDNGARILNLSWGGNSYSASLLAALQRVRAAGVLVVAAAGNDARNNDNLPIYPAGYELDNIVAVAATDRRDSLAWFSNYGPARVHIAAPGAEILSTWIGGASATRTLSGTSMAAPHVSGAAALLAARFPADNHRQLVNRILGGADSIEGLPVARSARLNLHGSLATAQPVPVNDSFARADHSSLHGVVWRGDNTHAAAEPGEPAHVSGGALRSVWYRWTPPVSGQATLTFGPTFSGRAAVYAGVTVSSLSAVASTASAPITFNVVAGTSYHIAVDGNSGATGNFSLALSIPPANDDKAAATVVAGDSWSVSGSNIGAGLEPGETSHANVPGGRSVWWRWTAPLDGPVRISTDGSDFDTSIAVYDDAGSQAVIQGEQPDVVFVVDVSGSTADGVKGGYVGDTNADGRANTILDAEVAACLALRQTLLESGKPVRVSVVKFGDTAALLDMDPAAPGAQPFTDVNADLDANGVPDIIQVLRTLRAGGLTNYTDGLARASDAFSALGTSPGNGTLVFLSDGKPSDSGNFGAVAESLRSDGHLLHAYGAGGGSSLASLQLITPQALIFTDIAELVAVFNGAVAANDDHAGLLTSEVNFSARAGQTYSIAVDGYKAATGTIQLAAQYSQTITIISQPRDTSVERFAPARLDVGVRGVAPFNYQWFKDGVLIPEATGASLIIDQADIANAGAYHVVVNNTFATVTSRAATLDVIVRAPVITREIVNQTVVAGSQVVFRANAVGTAPFTYQWFKNGAELEDATQSELLIPTASATDAGTYHVVITNESGTTTSRTAFLTLADSPFDTWVRRSPQFAPHGVTGVTFDGGKFIVFGYNGFIATSIDGLNWTDAKVPGAYFGKGAPENVTFRKVTHLNGAFFAFGDYTINFNSTKVLYRSLDGLVWEKLPNPSRIFDLSFINGTFVGHGLNEAGQQAYYRTEDLATWTFIERFGYEVMPLIEKGAAWKYLANATSYPSNWTAASFNDSSWSSGAAELGYGDGNETTVVSAGTTTLFRHIVPAARTGYVRIIGEHLSDDGILVTVNGTQIFRHNLPAGSLNPWTPASSGVEGAAETTYNAYAASSTHLLAANNCFAVEVHQSTDGTHDMSFDLSASAEFFYTSHGPAVGNGRMVVLRGDGRSFTSTDGVTWTMHSDNGLDNAAANQFYPPDGLVFINGHFMAWNKINKRLYRSTDGITWTLHSTNAQIESLTWDGQHYHFFNSTSVLFYSTDAITWSFKLLSGAGGDYVKPVFGAAGNGSVTLVSYNGAAAIVNRVIDTTSTLMPVIPSQGRRLRILNGALVSLADAGHGWINNYTRLSYDGAIWKKITGTPSDLAYGHHVYVQFYSDRPAWTHDLLVPPGSSAQWTAPDATWSPGWVASSQVFANDRFVAVGPDGGIATSADAVEWTIARAQVPSDADLTWVDHVGGIFFALGRDGFIITSADGVIWNTTTLSDGVRAPDHLTGVAFGNGLYVVGTANGTDTEFFTSPDAVTWTRVIAGQYGGVRDVTFGDGHFAAVTGRRVVFSADGMNWAATDLPGDEGRAIAFYKDTFVIVGDSSTVFQSGSVHTTPPAPVLSGVEAGATFTTNDPIRVEITGSPSGSEIVSVDFILNGELVSSLASGPFVWSGTAGQPGDYRLSIVARDADGNVSFTHTTFTVDFSPWQQVSPALPSYFVGTFTAPDGTLYGLGGESLSVGKVSVIARSRDGLEWHRVRAVANENDLVRMAASDDGTLVATGNDAYVLTSGDGESWTRVDIPLSGVFLAWGNGLFVAVPGSNPSSTLISLDGRAWDRVNNGSSLFGDNITDFIFRDGSFLVVTRLGNVFSSPNGVTWTRLTPAPLWSGNRSPKFVVGSPNLCLVASDIFEHTSATGWQTKPRPEGLSLARLVHADGRYLGASALGLHVSDDLLNWTRSYTATSESDTLIQSGLTWIDNRWLAYRKNSSTPLVATSEDAATWQRHLFVDPVVPQRATERNLGGIATDGEQLLAVGSHGLLQSTTDGRTWTQQPYIGTESLAALVYAENKWVAAGATGAVYTSPDGSIWTKRTTGTTRQLRKILHNGTRFVIYGDQVMLGSDDAETWTAITTVNGTAVPSLFAGIVTQGRFALLGTTTDLYSSNDGITWQRANIGLVPMQHGYRIADTGDGVLIPGDYSSSYGSDYIISSDDLINWTIEYRDMPEVYQTDASIADTRLSTQNNGGSGFRFSLDAGTTWFTAVNNRGYGSVAAFKGGYYAVGGNLRVDTFSLVDLQVADAQLTTDPSPGPGSPVHVEWHVVNRGYVDHADGRPLRIEVRLGRTPDEFNHTDIVLVDETFDDALAVGQALHFSRDLVLPPDIAVGDYYLKIRVDGLSHLPELNESNNVFFSAAPALAIQAWTLSVTQTPGGVVRGGLQSGVGTLSTERASAGGFVTLGTRTVLANRSLIDLVAVPAKGFGFVGWLEHPSQTFESLSLEMDRDHSVTPLFSPLRTVTAHVAGQGVVSINPDDGVHLDGDLVYVQATPAAGWRFTGWSGGFTGTDAARSHTVDGDFTATATFAPIGVALADWKQARFGSDVGVPEIAGDAADPDGDGIVNLLEYALGGDPLLAEQGIRWSLATRGGELVLTFTLDQQSTDVVVSAESTATLADPLSWSVSGITWEVVEEDARTKTIEARVPLDGGARFMRLRVLR